MYHIGLKIERKLLFQNLHLTIALKYYVSCEIHIVFHQICIYSGITVICLMEITDYSVNSPKNKACSSKGKCMIQSSLTLWSTTISVMKMTAILHLNKTKQKNIL